MKEPDRVKGATPFTSYPREGNNEKEGNKNELQLRISQEECNAITG